MHRSCLVLCALAGLGTSTSAQQSAKRWDTAAPVWGQVKALRCKATELHACTLGGACERKEPSALWRVDFERNLIEFQVSVFGKATVIQEQILARDSRPSPLPPGPLRMSLLLSSGRVMQMRYDEAGGLAAWSVGVPDASYDKRKLQMLTFAWQCQPL